MDSQQRRKTITQIKKAVFLFVFVGKNGHGLIDKNCFILN